MPIRVRCATTLASIARVETKEVKLVKAFRSILRIDIVNVGG